LSVIKQENQLKMPFLSAKFRSVSDFYSYVLQKHCLQGINLNVYFGAKDASFAGWLSNAAGRPGRGHSFET
jgi:hypothetical protein